MARQFTLWYKALLSSLITMLGFTACDDSPFEPKEEYGSPYVRYTVKGRVTDAEGQPLKGIQAEVGQSYPEHFERIVNPTLTDADGHLDITFETNGYDQNTRLVLKDIDGKAGGGYFGTDSILVSGLPRKKTEEGRHWFQGAYEYTANITMTKLSDNEQ